MTGDQHGRDRVRVEIAEGAHDHFAGRLLVFAGDLLRRHVRRHRHGPVEIVGMGRAEAGDRPSRLRPGGRVFGMGVGDAADIGERLVEFQMGRQVGRGAQIAVDDPAVEIGHDDLLRRQLLIGNAARLDRHQAVLARDAADVAEGENDHAAANQFEVRVEDFLAQVSEQHAIVSRRSAAKAGRISCQRGQGSAVLSYYRDEKANARVLSMTGPETLEWCGVP